MRVGIVTRYYRAECTFSALTLAEHLLDTGRVPRIFATTAAGVPVHPYWDGRVSHERRAGDFQRWCQRNDVVVWTHLPDESMLHWVGAKSIRNVLVLDWLNVTPGDIAELRAMDHVVAPHRAGADLLSGIYGVDGDAASKLVHCPWAPTAAVSLGGGESRCDSCRVLVVCEGLPTVEAFDALCASLVGALADCPALRLTVAADSASPPIGKGLRPIAAAARSGDRVRIVPYPGYADFPGLIASHDALLYPAAVAGFAYPALWAIARGVPVVCYHNPPYGAVVRESGCGLSLDCARAMTDAGVACVRDYDPAPLVGAVVRLASDPTALRQFRGNINYSKTLRRGFELTWSGLLRDDA